MVDSDRPYARWLRVKVGDVWIADSKRALLINDPSVRNDIPVAGLSLVGIVRMVAALLEPRSNLTSSCGK